MTWKSANRAEALEFAVRSREGAEMCVRERDGLSDEEKEEKCGWRVKKHP